MTIIGYPKRVGLSSEKKGEKRAGKKSAGGDNSSPVLEISGLSRAGMPFVEGALSGG